MVVSDNKVTNFYDPGCLIKNFKCTYFAYLRIAFSANFSPGVKTNLINKPMVKVSTYLKNMYVIFSSYSVANLNTQLQKQTNTNKQI